VTTIGANRAWARHAAAGLRHASNGSQSLHRPLRSVATKFPDSYATGNELSCVMAVLPPGPDSRAVKCCRSLWDPTVFV